MNEKIKKLLKQFAIKAALLFIGWMIIYHGFIVPDGRANAWLTTQVVIGTKIGLEILGYDTTSGNLSNNSSEESAKFISIDGQPVVLVADPCNGFELIALFIGFIVSFPGPWKYKAIIIPIGSFLVFIINVFREIILALNYKYFQESFDFNHKYTYVFVVYFLIFLIWRFWLNRYSKIGNKIKHAD